MKTMEEVLDRLLRNYPDMAACAASIRVAVNELINRFENGGKLFLCGNGGSAADCEHIAGELLKGFTVRRPLPEIYREKFAAAGGDAGFIDNLQGALPVISLTSHPAFSTAYINDVDAAFVFAQQLFGLGQKDDMIIAISTSGNAQNVINAVITAKALEIKTIALTGAEGGRLAGLCDIVIKAPALETWRIQEYHLPIYHAVCEIVEKHFFSE